MNWFSVWLERWLPELDALAAEGSYTWDSSLRAIPYPALQDRLELPDTEDQLRQGFLLCEDAEPASQRAAAADPAAADELPIRFTLAIQTWSGTVVYLPEDREEQSSFQLFTDYGGTLARVRSDDGYKDGQLVLGRPQAVGPENGCSDGPCQDWGAGCGQGCRCRKFEIVDSIAPRLVKSLRPVAGTRYALRCR